MTNTAERAKILASHCLKTGSEQFLGDFSTANIIDWVTSELGDPQILDSYVSLQNSSNKTKTKTKAIPNGPILHILSGNTEHAGHQSLLRALIIGAENIVKLPSTGLPALTNWLETLPAELTKLVTVTSELTDEIFHSAKTIIAIGSDSTMEEVQKRITPQQRFIPHGHKLSIGLIDKPSPEAAKLAVQDACAFNQQGCLSLHSIYLKQDTRDFLPMLAEAMAEYEKVHPRGEISISESGAISNLRETVRYAASNDPENNAITHSEGNTHWTAIYKSSPTLTPSALNRVITVQPWPEDYSELGSERQFLSTVAMEPELVESNHHLDVPRICLLGKSQQPPLDWHHDGFQPLASLVHWQDIQL